MRRRLGAIKEQIALAIYTISGIDSFDKNEVQELKISLLNKSKFDDLSQKISKQSTLPHVDEIIDNYIEQRKPILIESDSDNDINIDSEDSFGDD